MFKSFLLGIAITISLLSINAQAQSQSQKQAACERLAGTAYSVMGARQRGARKEEMLNVASNQSDPQMGNFMWNMVNSAFEKPLHARPSNQEMEAKQFQQEYFNLCMRAM